MNREEQLQENKWNLTSFYEDNESWEKELQTLIDQSGKGFEEIKPKDFLKRSDAKEIKIVLDNYFNYLRKLEMIYVYAHLKHDVNIASPERKGMFERARSLYYEFQEASSWLEPSLLQIDEKKFNQLISDNNLSTYKFYLTKLKDQKRHVLSKDKEQIMSLASRMQSTAKGAFSALSNVDMDFGMIEDSKGETYQLTQGSYAKHVKSADRTLRKNAFEKMYGSYVLFENTLAELIHGQVQNHVFNAKVRGYQDCLEAALKPHHIPSSVYHNLIDTISSNLTPMHKYTALKKKILGVDTLYTYDMYPSLSDYQEKKYTYAEACEIVINSVAILGKEYQSILKKGLLEQKWVDIYENKGKRSGAYSSGCYDSHPYILLNFQGTLNDVLTLAHEAGHSMNTYLSNQKQTYHDAGYTIFVAEVASTFNERLTYEYLLENAESKGERIYILNQQIEAIRSTFFRQAMFAEFELNIHEMTEKSIPLTATLMKKVYKELNEKYYGKELVVTDCAAAEYLRIPHFYYNFYVYQYSTGIAAAITLVEDVKKNGTEAYLGFLAAGGSKYSIDILKDAGADMSSVKPIEKTLKVFEDLVNQLKKELE